MPVSSSMPKCPIQSFSFALASSSYQGERAGEMHHGNLVGPAEIQSIIAPFAGHLRRHVRLRTALENPVIGGNHLLDQVERIGNGRVIGESEARHRVSPCPK